jgi:hypothetical protein
MSRLVYPYLRPAADVVEAGPWKLLLGGEEMDLPCSIDDWDYNLDLNLSRQVIVDVAAIREQARLPSHARLAVCAVWQSSGSGLFGSGRRVDLSGHDIRSVSLDLGVRGSDAGGALTLDTQVVLADPIAAHDFAPHRAGSILWNDRVSVRLQGDGSQFPIAIVDFGGGTLPEDAAWHLQVDGPLDAAAMGSMLLLINSRNKTVADAFAYAGKPRATDKLVLSAVYADVARTLVEHALAREDFVDEVDFDDDTLGAMLLDVFTQVFGQESIKDVRLRFQRDPSVVSTRVQSAVRIFGVEA